MITNRETEKETLGKIRQEKLIHIIDTMFNGKQIDFCRATGLPQSLVSRYASGKYMGNQVADDIERELNLPKGSMDGNAELPDRLNEDIDEDEELYRLIKLVISMPKEQRHKFIKVFEIVAGDTIKKNDNENS